MREYLGVMEVKLWSGGAIFGTCDLFHSGDMQCGKGNTPSIIEPDYDPIAARVYSGMIRARNGVSVTAAGHNRKRLKRSGVQMMADIFNHAGKMVNR